MAPLHSHPLLDRLYRIRHVEDQTQLNYTLANMLPPNLLQGMQAAVDLLIDVRAKQQKIVIVGDFDADGATSTALCVTALKQLGFTQVAFIIPDRFTQGYGLSVSVADTVLSTGAECVITVDNGISSIDGIKTLKNSGVRVLITDHHLPGETLPNADAIVNPNVASCAFPSKSIAGVGVAFYLMIALRAKLREQGAFAQQKEPDFRELLDLVALGTVADVVALDYNNRILVQHGMARIQKGQVRPGIRALIEVSNRQLSRLSTSDLSFAIAPRLNAAGRLDNMATGVELLLCDDPAQANQLASDLDALNQERRTIEAGMKAEALRLCQNLPQFENNALPYAIALYQKDWHQGVLGILASRIKDKYHRPTITFTDDESGVLRGSARSIDGVHIRDVLARIDSQHPEMMTKFGGHAMAAGLSLRTEKLEKFQRALNQAVQDIAQPEQLQPVIWTDGELKSEWLNLETAKLLQQAGPWGQAFPAPVFDGKFRIIKQTLLKGAHLKLLLEPIHGGPLLDGIAFNVDTTLHPDPAMKTLHLVYRLDINEFRGQQSVQLIIEHLEPL